MLAKEDFHATRSAVCFIITLANGFKGLRLNVRVDLDNNYRRYYRDWYLYEVPWFQLTEYTDDFSYL